MSVGPRSLSDRVSVFRRSGGSRFAVCWQLARCRMALVWESASDGQTVGSASDRPTVGELSAKGFVVVGWRSVCRPPIGQQSPLCRLAITWGSAGDVLAICQRSGSTRLKVGPPSLNGQLTIAWRLGGGRVAVCLQLASCRMAFVW